MKLTITVLFFLCWMLLWFIISQVRHICQIEKELKIKLDRSHWYDGGCPDQ